VSDRRDVRVSDQDPEILAMKAITAALEPMDPKDRERVLKWADARFGSAAYMAMVGEMERAFIDLLGNIQKAAEKGGTSWPALVRIVEEVYRLQVQERDRLKRAEQEQKELAWAEANS
jgi:hypothetical protein